VVRGSIVRSCENWAWLSGRAPAAVRVRRSHEFTEIELDVRVAVQYAEVIVARNVKRIESVDHTRDGVFLFNFFFADRRECSLAVREYAAGWFERKLDPAIRPCLTRSIVPTQLIGSSTTVARTVFATCRRPLSLSARSGTVCSRSSRPITPRRCRSPIRLA
jgi:hypothetical protein